MVGSVLLSLLKIFRTLSAEVVGSSDYIDILCVAQLVLIYASPRFLRELHLIYIRTLLGAMSPPGAPWRL